MNFTPEQWRELCERAHRADYACRETADRCHADAEQILKNGYSEEEAKEARVEERHWRTDAAYWQALVHTIIEAQKGGEK